MQTKVQNQYSNNILNNQNYILWKSLKRRVYYKYLVNKTIKKILKTLYFKPKILYISLLIFIGIYIIFYCLLFTTIGLKWAIWVALIITIQFINVIFLFIFVVIKNIYFVTIYIITFFVKYPFIIRSNLTWETFEIIEKWTKKIPENKYLTIKLWESKNKNIL